VVKPTRADVWRLVAEVPDPEIPVATIADLGILRRVAITDDSVVVTITPTYSGCPAMDTIRADIVARLHEAGIENVEVRTVLAPAWTSDWITEAGRRKLHDFGIAPPRPAHALVQLSVCCPRCRSFDVREVSRFGSTACKALYACNACQEPFDYFKRF
jgi:ring-1,2-phenylacetyl-CoA epoxidase subunit PaaD